MGAGCSFKHSEEDAITVFSFAVEKLADLLAKEGAFAGNGAATGHGFEADDRFYQPLVPFLGSFRGGVLSKAEEGCIGFGFGQRWKGQSGRSCFQRQAVLFVLLGDKVFKA